MKKIYYAIVVSLSFLVACNSEGEKAGASITGVYVQKISNEFAKGDDSLIVNVLDKNAGTYSVQKNYGFMRYLDGEEKGRDYTTQKYTTVYDKEHKQLIDDFKGVIFTFMPDKNVLLMGSAEYKKLK